MAARRIDIPFHADIIVVGAGPGGTMLATLLARAGKDVLLIERQAIADKRKLCGGVILASGMRLLDSVHGKRFVKKLDGVHLQGMRVLYGENETTIPYGAFACPRENLDRLLAERYVKKRGLLRKGGLLVDKLDVRSVDEAAHEVLARDVWTGGIGRLDSDFRISYDTLVAADGAASRIRALVTGARPQTHICFAAATEPLAGPPVLTQRTYSRIAGSCWHIPQGKQAVIGGLFLPEPTQVEPDEQKALIEAFATALGLPRPELRGAPVTTGTDICLRSAGGTYFVGDAAGLIEPALAAGIHLALTSAAALAEDLCGGQRYEDLMAGTCAKQRAFAQNTLFPYLRLSLAVLRANEKKNQAELEAKKKQP